MKLDQRAVPMIVLGCISVIGIIAVSIVDTVKVLKQNPCQESKP